MAHVTSVHYAISNPFIYTIIFNFFPDGRGLCFESSLIHLIYAMFLFNFFPDGRGLCFFYLVRLRFAFF